MLINHYTFRVTVQLFDTLLYKALLNHALGLLHTANLGLRRNHFGPQTTPEPVPIEHGIICHILSVGSTATAASTHEPSRPVHHSAEFASVANVVVDGIVHTNVAERRGSQLEIATLRPIVVQRGNDRPVRRDLPRLIDVLPQLRIVRRQIRVAIHAAGQIQVAGLFASDRRRRRRGGRFRLWGRRRENGTDIAGYGIQHGCDRLAVDYRDFATFLDTGRELSLDVLGRVGGQKVELS